MIPVNPDVQLFEPNQRALIAWNGEEEILLLSTDVRASDSTLVLEVLPLPTEPEVKKGSLETFEKAIALINRKIQLAHAAKGRTLSEGIVPPSGEVTFHKKIGAHDISVAHVLDTDGFVEWIYNYLRSIGFEEKVVSADMKALIEDYINGNFVWFVFDVVSVAAETATNEPIQYRFKTPSLFYPLKITSTSEGNTSIELIILTPRLLQIFPGLPISRVRLKHEPISITNHELKDLNEDMYELLKQHETLRLRIWEIRGELKLFDTDLIAR
jgi:hypothetical protein